MKAADRSIHRWAPLVAIVVLAVIGIASATRPAPADADPYHARVREAVRSVPRDIGNWVGRDDELPAAATQLLRPNATLARSYTDLATGRRVILVVVQTRDARDMAGHYPPNCYPGAGWTLDDTTPRTWEVQGVKITGTAYAFRFSHAGGTTRKVIDNLLILPDGRFARNMGDVYRLGGDHTRRFFGAAQVQLLTEADLPEDEREAIRQEFFAALLPLIDQIASAGNAAADTPQDGTGTLQH